ncbi:hypothetical protein Tco_0336532 [Tanacetum coccineum]
MSQSSPLRLHPPTATNGEHGCSGCRFHISSQRFRVSISNIIRCEGVDWAMIVSQSKKNTDLKTMDVGGHGFDDDFYWSSSYTLPRLYSCIGDAMNKRGNDSKKINPLVSDITSILLYCIDETQWHVCGV